MVDGTEAPKQGGGDDGHEELGQFNPATLRLWAASALYMYVYIYIGSSYSLVTAHVVLGRRTVCTTYSTGCARGARGRELRGEVLG